MNYRLAVIYDELTLPAVAGTITIPIRLEEPISRIAIKFQVTKSLNCMTGHPAEDITRIEIVDGSDVLHSSTGLENQSLCIFDRKTPTMWNGVALINNAQESMYGIDFGRWLFDPELAFDPKRFSMPQLRITYNSRVSDTGATVPRLMAVAYVFDEKVINPVGFLMSKEHHSSACPANNAYLYVEMPIDYPYRRFLLRAHLLRTNPQTNVQHIRLDEDNLRRLPIDMNMEDYIYLSMCRWQQVNEPLHICIEGANQNFFFTASNYFNMVGGEVTAAAHPVSAVRALTGGNVELSSTEVTTMMGQTMGWCPNHSIDYEFGDVNDLNDWYDVTKVGNLRLRVQGGASGIAAAYQVLLQQLRYY